MNPFDALEHALLAAHPGAEFLYFGGVPAQSDHALNGAVVVRVAEPTPHWLIVSQGFTELWDKQSPEPSTSGLGFELVCRVPALADEFDAGWVLYWMQGVADSLAASRTSLAQGHTMDVLEPSHDGEVCALAFVADAELAPTASDNGRFEFLQMVGLRPRELAAARAWNTDGYTGLLRERDPLCIFDPAAGCPLDDEAFRRRVDESTAREGSSLGMLTGVPLRWTTAGDELRLHLEAGAVEPVVRALTDRLEQGALMMFHGTLDDPQQVVVLRPEDGASAVEVRDGAEGAIVHLGPAARAALRGALAAPDDVPAAGVRLPGSNVRVFVGAVR